MAMYCVSVVLLLSLKLYLYLELLVKVHKKVYYMLPNMPVQ